KQQRQKDKQKYLLASVIILAILLVGAIIAIIVFYVKPTTPPPEPTAGVDYINVTLTATRASQLTGLDIITKIRVLIMNQSPNEAFLGLGTALSEVEDPLKIDSNRMQLGTLAIEDNDVRALTDHQTLMPLLHHQYTLSPLHFNDMNA
ncbi:hypothetical protein LSH36_1291g00035, partial [Paralvinella palmiformis]